MGEKEIELEQENIIVYSGGGAVNSVNGYTGDVVLTTSDIENTSDYQTGTEVESAITTAISGLDIPTKTSELTNDGSDGNSTYVEADELATVATSGSYNDLLNKPTIPAAQVNSDWDAISGVAQILNKPTLSTVATSGSYDDLLNKPTIPTVNNATLTITQNGTSAGTFTANDDTDTTIALTDTTYNNFTGTDGTAAGAAGLVPAPATTDAGKFLKADGTWDTAGGGSGPTVVQTTGTSTTDVMSQNATTSMVYADPSTTQKVNIGGSIDNNAAYGTVVGYQAAIVGNVSNRAVAIGYRASANAPGAVALGTGSSASTTGEVNIGSLASTAYGYNNSNYRLLTGIYDAQSDHDAVNLSQLNGRVKQNAGTPTTATEGTVGQLLEDTTNGKLYQCTAVDTTDPQNPSYTWTEVGAGGGGGPTVVQTTGTSTTDVMSQNATTSMVFADPGTKEKVHIGASSPSQAGAEAVTIGVLAKNSYATQCTNVGAGSSAGNAYRSVAFGYKTSIEGSYNVCLGSFSKTDTSMQGVVQVGLNASLAPAGGYNNSQYRLITGLYDPQSDHDAATKGYCDNAIINGGTTAPTTATVGAVGTQYTYVDTTGTPTAHLCVCTEIDTTDPSSPVYTWQTLI